MYGGNFNARGQYYEVDHIGAESTWTECPLYNLCSVIPDGYFRDNIDDQQMYVTFTIQNDSDHAVIIWYYDSEGQSVFYKSIDSGATILTSKDENYLYRPYFVTDEEQSDALYSMDGKAVFVVQFTDRDKLISIQAGQGVNPGLLTPRDYRGECCEDYTENEDGCCVGYDYCANNFRTACDGTICEEFDACYPFGDVEVEVPINEDTGDYCYNFQFCYEDISPWSEFDKWDTEILFDLTGQCCYFEPCDTTRPLDCFNDRCYNYLFCENGYNTDWTNEVFCNPYEPVRYRQTATGDLYHTCDTFYNDEQTWGIPSDDGEVHNEWENFIYPEKFTNNGHEDQSDCFYDSPKADPESEYLFEDPCILYYDPFGNDPREGAICALCKFNSIRIITKLDSDHWMAFCGYTDYDPDLEDAVDSILNQEDTYRCYLDDYYIQRMRIVNLDQHFYPTEKTYNTTTGAWEIFCVVGTDFEDQSCAYSEPILDSVRKSEMMASNPHSLDVYYQTIGCRICEAGYITRVRLLEDVGMREVYCESDENYDSTTENIPCEEVGHIQMLQGYIPEEQTLECLECDTQIPNCLVCQNTATCDLCKVSFVQASLKDAHGNTNSVCIKDFCGLDGKGISCSIPPTIPNCLRSLVNAVRDSIVLVEDCQICEPGYHFEYSYYVNAFPNHVLRTCAKGEGELEYDLFIKPSQERLLTSTEEADMYRQFTDKDSGKTIDDAFYYLAQAFTRLGQATLPAQIASWLQEKYQTIEEIAQSDANYEIEFDQRNSTLDDLREEWWAYENVTINIWLAKGHHHFIQCSEYTDFRISDQLPLLCRDYQTLLALGKRAPKSDNIKFYVRPLECNLRFSYFNTRPQGLNDDKFWEWCVDFEVGHPKPQIRIHDGRSMFNITNYAQFENIEFTAEDALATVNSDYEYYTGTSRVFKNIPLKKCNFVSEPTGSLEQASVEAVLDVMSDIEFDCLTGFNFTTDAPPTDYGEECDPADNSASNAVNTCEGEVWQQDFWHRELIPFSYASYDYTQCDSYVNQRGLTIVTCNEIPVKIHISDMQYTLRHKTLFNLYSFDTIHSERTHSPTLNLIDCDFKYFFNQSSLINVETNNFAEMGITFTSDRPRDLTFELVVGELGELPLSDSQNFKIDSEADVTTDRFIAYLGEDRGARISITNSTFKHSHFCKGMIVHKEQKTLEYEDFKAFVNYTANYIRQENITDGRAEPFIKIIDSVFENIGYQQTVTDLSFIDVESQVQDETVASYFGVSFKKFNNRGSILNVQGFPGTIEIRDSVFKRNMAYIQDALVQESATGDQFLSPSTMKYSDFHVDGGEYFRFKICRSFDNSPFYAFNSLFDPNTEFDDRDLVDKYESYSPIFISANKGAMMFIANNFTQNIGTIGGVINIQSPNFEQAMSDFEVKNSSSWTFKSCSSCSPTTHAENSLNETLPVIIIKDNIFERNMAYFAGNAFYISSTLRSTALFDYLQFCGAGIMIEDNLFENNIGMKRHNGGAGVVRCKRFATIDESIDDYFVSHQKTSGLFLKERNATDSELTSHGADNQDDLDYTYFEDPSTSVMNVTDLFDVDSDGLYQTNYTVMKYATYITNNTFRNNMSGKKGTALLVSQLSQLVIFQNLFEQNKPVSAVEEMKYSPYYEFFLRATRTSTYLPITVNGNTCNEEIAWYDKCQREGTQIDAPSTQGALYIESCHFLVSCYTQIPQNVIESYNQNNITEVEELTELLETMEQKLDVVKPMNAIDVKFNTFENNQAAALFSTTQLSYDQAQASAVYIIGGIHTHFYDNQFLSHVGGFGEQASANSSDIYSFMPENYFEYSHASVVRIEYPKGSSTLDIEGGYELFFKGNLFTDNKNYQITAYSDRFYHGSLLHFDCQIELVKLIFQDNLVQYNLFIGEQSSLFYINGGLMNIKRNTFTYNGMTSTKKLQNHPASLNRDQYSFPYQEFDTSLSQDAGVFLFDFDQHDIAEGNAHEIHENIFEHIYCDRGCAYAAKGDTVQQFWFQQNSYKYMVALSGGAVFDSASLDLPESNQFRDVWLQVYIKENIELTFGGAISVISTNVPITIIDQSAFINNYGDSGASISLDQGGGLYCSQCSFKMNQTRSTTILDKYGELIEEQDKMFRIIAGFEKQDWSVRHADAVQELTRASDLLIWAYNGARPMETFIDYDSLVEIVDAITNYDGQVKIQYSQIAIQNDQTWIQAYNNTVGNFIFDKFNMHILETDHSAFIYPWFIDCTGSVSSAMSIYSSHIDLRSNKYANYVNFEKNVAFKGTTIYAQDSIMVFDQIYMTDNYGNAGGCLNFASTQVTILDSIFARNMANQGGVFFAIQKSVFDVQRTYFVQNSAFDASVMYGLANIAEESLKFDDCTFSENYGKSNAIHMLLSSLSINNCTFTNNYAQYVTHGITLISSNLELSNSMIQFERHCYTAYNVDAYQFIQYCSEDIDFFERLDLSKLDTGFFNLYLTSTALITENTIIQNLLAQKQAVAYVIGQSSLQISNNVRFLNNEVLSSTDTSTLHFSNAADIEISDVHFENNPQINIELQLTNLKISNSSFTAGDKNLILAFQSSVQIIDVHMYNSSALVEGHGFSCTQCHDIVIANSTFENLKARQGGAIYIINMEDSASEFINNTFYNNQARYGGAISLVNPSRIYFHGNNFTQNAAISNRGQIAQRYCNSGALQYECTPKRDRRGNFESQGDCEVVLRENLFAKNTAKNKGGAVRYLNKNITFDTSLVYRDGQNDTGVRRRLNETEALNDTNIYESNSAVYGDNIASYPKYLSFNLSHHEDIHDEFSYIDTHSAENVIHMAPGQKINLTVTIYDLEGRIYVDENEAVANVGFVEDQVGLDVISVISGRESIASGGVLTFSALSIRQTPDSSSLIELQVSNLEFYNNDVDFLIEPPIFNVLARACVEGERYSNDLACVKCPVGFYLYLAQLEPGDCLTCDLHGNCHGQNFTSPRPGYWRSSPTSETYIKCLGDSCLGGDLQHPLGECDEGYSGVLCADCVNGYKRTGNFQCENCPNVWVNLLMSIVLLIASMFFIFVLIKSVIQGASTKKPLYAVYFKIFLNHYQLLQVISKILFDWPIEFEIFLSLQKFVMDIPITVLSPDCLLMQLFLGYNPSIRLNYLKGISFFLLPIVIVIISQICWRIYGCCSRLQREERTDYNMATISVVFFLFYPSIVFQTAELINCMDIEGTQHLYNDLEEVCYTGRHLLVTLFVAIPGLVLWAIGIPLFFLHRLLVWRRKLNDSQKKIETVMHNYLTHRFRIRLGFLTSGYTDDYYYWEIVLLLRKTVLVLLVTFLQAVSGGMQSLTFVVIITIFYFIQTKINPYYDQRLNNLERLSLFVLIITIYCGLFFQAGKTDVFLKNAIVKWVIFLCIFIPSCAFLIYFIDNMRTEVLKMISKRSKFLFRLFTCCRTDWRTFIEDHKHDDDDSLEEFDTIQTSSEQIRRMLTISLGGLDATQFAEKKQIQKIIKQNTQLQIQNERRSQKKANISAFQIFKTQLTKGLKVRNSDTSSLGSEFYAEDLENDKEVIDPNAIKLEVSEEEKSGDYTSMIIEDAAYPNTLSQRHKIYQGNEMTPQMGILDQQQNALKIISIQRLTESEVQDSASLAANLESELSDEQNSQILAQNNAFTPPIVAKKKKRSKKKKKKKSQSPKKRRSPTKTTDLIGASGVLKTVSKTSEKSKARNLSMDLGENVLLSSDRMEEVDSLNMFADKSMGKSFRSDEIVSSNKVSSLDSDIDINIPTAKQAPNIDGQEFATESRIDTVSIIPNKMDETDVDCSILNTLAQQKHSEVNVESRVNSSMNLHSSLMLSSDRMEMVDPDPDDILNEMLRQIQEKGKI